MRIKDPSDSSDIGEISMPSPGRIRIEFALQELPQSTTRESGKACSNAGCGSCGGAAITESTSCQCCSLNE